jgi:hypothetical protein
MGYMKILKPINIDDVKNFFNYDILHTIANFAYEVPKHVKILKKFFADIEKASVNHIYSNYQISFPITSSQGNFFRNKRNMLEFRINNHFIVRRANMKDDSLMGYDYKKHQNMKRFQINGQFRLESFYGQGKIHFGDVVVLDNMRRFKQKWDSPRKQTWKKCLLKQLGIKGHSRLNKDNDHQFFQKVIYHDNISEFIDAPIRPNFQANCTTFQNFIYYLMSS